MNGRMPRFGHAAKGLINTEVDVLEVGTGDTVVHDLKAGVFPSSVIEDVAIIGRYTTATLFMFCKANDHHGHKLHIEKEYVVEETCNPHRRWLVTDDPENYIGVYLLVPLRADFATS